MITLLFTHHRQGPRDRTPFERTAGTLHITRTRTFWENTGEHQWAGPDRPPGLLRLLSPGRYADLIASRYRNPPTTVEIIRTR